MINKQREKRKAIRRQDVLELHFARTSVYAFRRCYSSDCRYSSRALFDLACCLFDQTKKEKAHQ